MTVVLASVAFWAAVNFKLAGDDGTVETVKFRARFKRLPTKQREAVDQRLDANTLRDDVRELLEKRLEDPKAKLSKRQRARIAALLDAEPIDNDELLSMLLVDWDLRDKRGESIPFTEANLAECCAEWDGLEEALVIAFREARNIVASADAVEKNSDAPSATTSD